MQRRRFVGPVIAALALLAAAGCSDDGDDAATTTTTEAGTTVERAVDQEALDRVVDAVEQTVDEGTARFAVQVEAEDTGTGSDGVQPIDAEGEVDFENELRLVTLGSNQGELDVVIDGDVAYVELPATEGDDWMRIELGSLLDDEIGMGGPAAIPFQDPEDNLRVLAGSAVHAAEVGDEQIDGDGTTRYELVIDLQAAADETNEDVQEAVDRTAQRTGVQELEMEVWVDDDDLIRRVAYTLDLDQASVEEDEGDSSVDADPQGSVTVTIDYSDFGDEVDIQVPDDADVVDLDEEAVRDAFSGAAGSSDARDTTTSTRSGDDDEEDGDDTTTTSSTTTTTGG